MNERTFHMWYLVNVLAPEARTLLGAGEAMPEVEEAWDSWFLRIDETLSRALPLQTARKKREIHTKARKEIETVLRHEAGEEVDLSDLPPDHPDCPLPF